MPCCIYKCIRLLLYFQVIHMLVVIILVYVCCWTPLLMINVLQSIGVVSTQLRGTEKYLKMTFMLMAYLNR